MSSLSLEQYVKKLNSLFSVCKWCPCYPRYQGNVLLLQAFKEAVTLESTGVVALEDVPPFQIWNEVCIYRLKSVSIVLW